MEFPDYAKRLQDFASDYAKKRGYRFGDGVEHWLPHTAQQAANRIIERGSTDLAAAEAERAFAILVDAMIEAAERIPGYRIDRPDIIGERTLSDALAKLCPLWPIC
jgi:hypothetical protein